jgi:hypothetical protein
VKIINEHCFCRADEDAFGMSGCVFRSLTFEPGSQLQAIEPFALAGCFDLHTICIPASVKEMSGASFMLANLTDIQIESGSPYFQRTGNFIRDFDDLRLVRYFGQESEITIDNAIEVIGTYCFGYCCSIEKVQMESDCRVSSIEEGAFAKCFSLTSITISSSVTSLGKSVFFDSDLETVSFAQDSRLRDLGETAFSMCENLKSIALPPSVEIIGPFCFNSPTLVSVSLPSDSKLTRIEHAAFAGCCGLGSFFVPSLVEFIGTNCFFNCRSLNDLTFESPGHLRELLDLPPVAIARYGIPDSVEILSFSGDPNRCCACNLNFGHESQLRSIRIVDDRFDKDRGAQERSEFWQSPRGRSRRFFREPGVGPFRSFLHLAGRTLRVFRDNLEFE